MHHWFAILLIGIHLLSIPLVILHIDKPREPISRATATGLVLVDLLIAWGVYINFLT